ncbi:hypothetical protein [Streptomyces sp. NPDC056549]|uniref:hypothetical protein n=1 Tax=Streptomyces sp. NPDC056549 TaxID=3345864 RepID=UPI00369BA449
MTEVSNQSTGYCPNVTSWAAVTRDLDKAGLRRPSGFSHAGVPIHVVMRYLGHVTPTMTMHYAKTLAVTAEREFLRYKKVTADGRPAEVNTSDLYDLLHLDSALTACCQTAGACFRPGRSAPRATPA